MSDKPKEIKTVFAEALERQTPEDRAAYLDETCRGDAELRRKVEELLKSHDQAGSFLEFEDLHPEVTFDLSPSSEHEGTAIGPYKLLERIGEGGMAYVYMAEQTEPIRRRVALKIIRLGMDTKQVIARFEAERQALAMMDHPNIAKVFDAGATKTGRPYFAMELVKGVIITDYCDNNKLNTLERLGLFIQVCNAVQHAHQKGIIHRDIKPTNVMVTLHDGKPVPKVIDFGIAKATSQRLTEKTVFTRYAQMIGTPEYMSPEQAEFSGLDIDTRSDIYSLGVLLYELLTGATPFDAENLRGKGYGEMQRIIRESEPLKPSTKLSTMGDALTDIADHRKTSPGLLRKLISGDLDWIVMKTLEKDRARRYEAVNTLAKDIQRHLDNEPVEAGPPGTLYKIRKFIKKHRRTVAAAATIAALLIIGFAVSTTLYFSTERARNREAAARKVAEKAENLAEERAEDYRRSLYFNSIALADIAYRDGNMQRLGELLGLCPEDLRGWEWYRLNHISKPPCIIIRGHSGPIYPTGFSPNGKRVVSAWGKTVKVWDAATGAEVMNLDGHEALVTSVMFSADGKRIVSAGNDNMIKIWDAATGASLMTLPGHGAASFSPDGKRIVSGSEDSTIKVWDATSGDELMTLSGHSRAVLAVRFSPDGERIVSVGKDGTKVWDATVGTKLGEYEAFGPVVFSPDGKRICSGGLNGIIRVRDADSGAEVTTFRGHEQMVFAIAYSPDGKRIVTGSIDRSIKLWDAVNWNELMTLQGHQDLVLSASFSPDGRRIVSSSVDGTVRVWDASVKRDYMRLDGVRHSVFSPDNKRLASAGRDDNTIKVYDIATGAEVMTLCGHAGRVWSLAYSPDGRRIASASFDRTVRVWDAATGESLTILRGHGDRIWSVAYSPDGERIVSGSYDGTVRIWDAEKGTEIKSLTGHDGRVETVAFSSDGKLVASGSWDNTVKLWDAETGDELKSLVGHKHGISDVAFSPDCRRIISGSWDNTVKVWDAETGKDMMTLSGHKWRVRSVAVSPDGKRIVSSCGDTNADNIENSAMKVWDIATGAELMTLRSNNIRSIAFSPDGNTIAVDSHNGITLLETKAPLAGYEPRRTAIIARDIVDKLHDEQGLYSKVVQKLEGDKTLAGPVRELALQIANTRLWEDVKKPAGDEK